MHQPSRLCGRQKSTFRRSALCATILSAVVLCDAATAQPRVSVDIPGVRGTCDPCDTNCDGTRDAQDVPPFVNAVLGASQACSLCAADCNANGLRDGRDIGPFLACLLAPPPQGACCTAGGVCLVTVEANCGGYWLGPGTACQPSPCAVANLTAYRPQHGTGYFPFARTAVSEADEENPLTGPGIRINAPGDADPMGEDDLIEVQIQTSAAAVPLALRRDAAALRVWTSRTKMPGTEIPFVAEKTGPLPIVGGVLTVWVEWAVAQQGEAVLSLEPLSASLTLDALRFHTFRSIVLALGGEGQVPSVPADPNHGTFLVGVDLYALGYDVFLHDEDDVTADGSGPVYDEMVDAVRTRQVSEIAIFGYSHGGGSTYDLAERLNNNRPQIGTFTIRFTSYVDAVGNDSDFDVSQELRRPPASAYHANHYQHGTLADFFLDGGPVPNSNPPPTGLDVETTPWGAGATHFQIDDFVQVRDYIKARLIENVDR